MQGLEEVPQRLLDGLVNQHRELLRMRDSLGLMVRMVDGLVDQVRAHPREEVMALAASLDGVREQMRLLEAQFTDSLAERLQGLTALVESFQEELRRQTSLSKLGELSASVAHEIRNPLCGILLSVEVLETKMDPHDSRSVLLENLHREAERMERVVNNLLQFSRQCTPRRVLCDVAELMRKSAASLRAHIHRKNIELKLCRLAQNCSAEVDPHLLQQVFSNLLMNALEACPDGSSIIIEVKEGTSGEAVVAITDQGKGIQAHLLDKIFEPFFTSKPNGNGLGLAVSKKIVEAHGGRIEVSSEEGRGSTFTVVLPRTAPQPATVGATA